MQSYRWHPSITASMSGPVVGAMPVHLQQSDLDGACGTHCALMALMAFGIVHRDELDCLPRARKKRLTALWRRTERHYFRGLYAGQLQSVLEPYAKDLICAIERSDCIKRALDVLQVSGLGIVNIRNDEINHWVLAVGSGGTEKDARYRPAWMLILDPSHGAIPLTPWNGLLSIRRDRKNRHAYDTPDGRLRVAVECVISLVRSNHGRN
jgi:hypothetical protein